MREVREVREVRKKEEERKKEKVEGNGEGVEKTDPEKEGEKAKEGKEVGKEIVDETREKEKLMIAEEFEEIMDGVRPVGSKNDDNVKSVDVGIEKMEDPDNVAEGNLSEEKAEGGEESEREVDPQEKDEGGKERKNTKRKLILETTEETQATGQKAKEGETVEISSEDEEEVTSLKKRNRAILTDQEWDKAVEKRGETTPVTTPESVALVAAKDPPTPVVPQGKPASDSAEPEKQVDEEVVEEDGIPEDGSKDEDERYRCERK